MTCSGTIELPVPGKHNVYNAFAATAVGLEMDVPFDKIAEAFAVSKTPTAAFNSKVLRTESPS